jgi:hypothetical protein
MIHMLRTLLAPALLLHALVGCQSTNREPAPAYVFSSPEEGFSSMLQSLRANDIEKDLGRRTNAKADRIRAYDPDDSWTRVETFKS